MKVNLIADIKSSINYLFPIPNLFKSFNYFDMVVRMLVRYCSLRPIIRMTSSTEFSAHRMIAAYSNGWIQDPNNDDYKNAIICLNRLQSNAATIKESLGSGTFVQNLRYKDTITYLERSGVSLEDLDKLSVIHVSGTKGKGTTCALTETLLRSYEVKTGFFSSPHLISVTERIRINGIPISEKLFSSYFWKVWNCLNTHKQNDNDMPAYFKFLTILCFHIFLGENIEVAILEVGIGGEFDSTNIVRNTRTVGITSLGLEHTNILGHTLEEIALQKAGIIKENSNVFTSVTQDVCLDVIQEKCMERSAHLTKVQKLDMINWNVEQIVKVNASLAIHLAYDWLKSNKFEKLNGISSYVLDGDLHKLLPTAQTIFESFQFPGRFQYLKIKNLNIYLDGAHTEESINLCSKWFTKTTNNNGNEKVLVFNLTGDREAEKLLKCIVNNCDISLVCFTPNTPFLNDKLNINNLTTQSEMEKLLKVQDIFKKCKTTVKSNSTLFSSILDSLNHISGRCNNNGEIDVLITGSIHLIGATLLALEIFSKNKL